MKETYEKAISQVFRDEGGYSNDAGDPGGPTNWGITIIDARRYWKHDATAEDVKHMEKSVAEQIYIQHYANPLSYDSLPAGVDYAVLDYGINSGISRSARVLQQIVGVTQDGTIGPVTIAAIANHSPTDIINSIYDERLKFLKSLHTWSIFGKGWAARCNNGRALALNLNQTFRKEAKPMTDNTAVVTQVQDAVKTIESVLPTVISIVGTFWAPANAITPFLPLIMQGLNAVDIVAQDAGKDIATAIQDVIDHLTPGKPNSPALS